MINYIVCLIKLLYIAYTLSVQLLINMVWIQTQLTFCYWSGRIKIPIGAMKMEHSFCQVKLYPTEMELAKTPFLGKVHPTVLSRTSLTYKNTSREVTICCQYDILEYKHSIFYIIVIFMFCDFPCQVDLK